MGAIRNNISLSNSGAACVSWYKLGIIFHIIIIFIIYSEGRKKYSYPTFEESSRGNRLRGSVAQSPTTLMRLRERMPPAGLAAFFVRSCCAVLLLLLLQRDASLFTSLGPANQQQDVLFVA